MIAINNLMKSKYKQNLPKVDLKYRVKYKNIENKTVRNSVYKKEIRNLCKRYQPNKNWKDPNTKIGIADILLTFRINPDLLYGISVYPSGEIITFDQKVGDLEMIWDLENDDLDSQDPEVIDFIFLELFKKEEDYEDI